jgi:pyruvate formate lyase activating enzyme
MIASRRGFIDGVVITGGEPTLQPDLEDFIREIRKIGVLIKLDTNGSHPEILDRLLANKRVDYIAMDIKTSWKKYRAAAGVDIYAARLRRSIDLIKESGIDFEFRTTCVPSLVDESDIEEISNLVGKQGSYTLQQFQPQSTLDPEYSKIEPYSRDKLFHFAEIASHNVSVCRIVGI